MRWSAYRSGFEIRPEKSVRIMRRILVDAARAQGTAKRGGQFEQVAHSSDID